MPFLGVSPTQEFTSVAKQTITGDGSTSYTLNKGVSTENDLAVFVNDVRQEPGVAYTASANTITFTANLESTDDCYILHIGRTFSSAESPGITDNATQKVLTITTDGHVVPTANVTYDLGTSDLRFRDIYLSGSSIELGDHSITANATHISMGNVVTTGVMTGNGALVTSLNASELASGTIPLARLPDDITVVNDLTIGGDFIVNGNTTTIAANELKVEDSLIQLASNNEISDTVDIGFVGHYSNDGGTTALHTGFFRDASNEYYYLFNSYEDDAFDTATPPSTIDRSANTFTLANFVANNVGMGSDPFLSNNYSTLNIRSTTGGQILLGRDSGTNDWDFFAYSASTHTAIGTTANTYLTFHTDSTGASNERMRIDSSGNVGIGTTSTSGIQGLLHIHSSSDDNGDGDGEVNFGDESTVIISTNATTAGGQGYYGSLFFGGQDINSATQQVWKLAGFSAYSAPDLGTTGSADLLFYTTNSSSTPTERMRIVSSGHVGIGTTDPSVQFEVKDDTTWDTAHFMGGSTIGAGFTLDATDTGVKWSLIAQGTTGGANDNNLGFHLTNAGTSGESAGYKFVMTPAGNFGIGTLSPSDELEISAASPAILITDTDTSDTFRLKQTNTLSEIQASTNFAIDTNATERMRIDSNGNVGIDETNPSERLELTRIAGKIGWGMNGNYGVRIGYFDDGGGTHGFHIDTKHAGTTTSESRFIVRADSGNVGIGTNNPTEKLEVSGGSFLVDAFTAGNEEGIFFRRGFTNTNKYNMSILAYDHNNAGVSPDGLSINSSEAISFSTGSNSRNEVMRINGNGNVGIGTDDPTSKLEIAGDVKIPATNVFGWRYNSGDSNMYNYIYNDYTISGGIKYRSGSWTSGTNITCHDFQTQISGAWTSRLKILQNGEIYISGHVHYGSDATSGNNDQGPRIRYGSDNASYGAIRFYQAGSNVSTIHSFATAWQGGSLSGSAAGSINIQGSSGVTFGPWNALDGYIDTSGNMWIAGTLTEASAMRYKENIRDLEYNNIISYLKPKIYNRIGEKNDEIGLIAEDVEVLDKNLVTYNDEGKVDGIHYTRLVPHLIAHIQKLEERLAVLENG